MLEPATGVVGQIWDVVSIAFGLGLVIVFGDLFVSASVHFASKYRIPKALLGLTVVAFGTSLPELSISLTSIFQGADDLAIGNIVGSNIFNILVVLGVPAAIFLLQATETRVILANAAYMMLVTLVFITLALVPDERLSLVDGIILFVLLAGFLTLCIRQARRAGQEAFAEDVDEIEQSPLLWVKKPHDIFALAVIVTAGVGLWFSADFTIAAGNHLAESYQGITTSIVGLTIIALGTSLPELSTTMAAARRKHYGMAIGNVVGSNIFNLATIGGAATLAAASRENTPFIDLASMNETALSPLGIWFDILVMVFVTAYLTTVIFLRKGRLRRMSGIFLLSGYLAYIVYLFWPSLTGTH